MTRDVSERARYAQSGEDLADIALLGPVSTKVAIVWCPSRGRELELSWWRWLAIPVSHVPRRA